MGFTWALLAALLIYDITAVPNILFILIDDLGWNDLSLHNGSDFSTPNIDNLASTALELNNYYIQHICTPTRSSNPYRFTKWCNFSRSTILITFRFNNYS